MKQLMKTQSSELIISFSPHKRHKELAIHRLGSSANSVTNQIYVIMEKESKLIAALVVIPPPLLMVSGNVSFT